MRYAPDSFSVCPVCIRSYRVNPRIEAYRRPAHAPSGASGCPHCAARAGRHRVVSAPPPLPAQRTMHLDETQRLPVVDEVTEASRQAAEALAGQRHSAMNLRALAVGTAVTLALIVPAAWLWLL